MIKASKIILINKNKEILFHLRDNKPTIPFPGYWALLGGGINRNEKPLSALKREIKEEIGIDLKEVVFLGKYYLDKVEENSQWVLRDYEVFIFKEKTELLLDSIKLSEGQKLRYFSFGKIMNLKTPSELKDFIIKNKKNIFD